jgi:diaminobutyrate-2-oxoglutarate transaminase
VNSFDTYESNVRYYCRRWPAVFETSKGALITDEHGTEYLDFFAGAGALNYGHNNPLFVDIAIEHLRQGRLMHSLDTFTVEKRNFLNAIHNIIVAPRGLDMVVQTVGPTGATAVEAALQLAQRITGKRAVLGFTGGYHGMSYRAASVSHSMGRRETSAHLGDFVALPFVATMQDSDVTLLHETLDSLVDGQPIGVIIVEPTQGEGGARAFDPRYLAELRKAASARDILVIADEVQAGIGRTGTFFSFEGSGLDPDIICLSKSISGLGLPMAVNLVRRSLDTWAPGEFTGTFRGNNLAFATSTAMLENYWRSDATEIATRAKGEIVRHALQQIADQYGEGNFEVRGKGMLCGLDVKDTALADAIATQAFDEKLIIETCGAGGTTVKLIPPIVIDDALLEEGLNRLHRVVGSVRVSS